MGNFLNRGVSTPLAVGIIAIAALLCAGAIIYYLNAPETIDAPLLLESHDQNKTQENENLPIQENDIIPAPQTKEQLCISSGGTVSTITCYCNGTPDFYDSCVIGGCACPPNPENARQIKSCECQEGKCFNGTICVSQ